MSCLLFLSDSLWLAKRRLEKGGKGVGCFLFLVRYLKRLKMREERRYVLLPVFVCFVIAAKGKAKKRREGRGEFISYLWCLKTLKVREMRSDMFFPMLAFSIVA